MQDGYGAWRGTSAGVRVRLAILGGLIVTAKGLMDFDRESFERAQAVARQTSALPAATYNLTRILLVNSPRGCVFVPIRSMQYLAVIDQEEIIFVDSQYRRWVEIAWQGFKPQARAALDEPVSYQAVFYTPSGGETQRRLQAEFHAALALLEKRSRPTRPARVLPLPGKTVAQGE